MQDPTAALWRRYYGVVYDEVADCPHGVKVKIRPELFEFWKGRVDEAGWPTRDSAAPEEDE